MECKKEEAIRTMQIAEKRLLKQDYAGAKVMALKAKKLFPLHNISQLLTLCEVHCSAQLMANGLYDWYKIIQVEPLSDEIMIRKQYHKLALLLHPDKNKIPGAEAAFKLLVEANNILSDRAKRTMYDIKRKHLASSVGQQQRTETNSAHNSSSNFNRANRWKPQQQPELHRHQGFTFWTECPGCMTRHQYYHNILSHIVCCTHCSRNFMANAPPHLNLGHMDGGRNQHQQYEPQGFTFWTECPGCMTRHQYYHNILSQIVCCTQCSRNFIANAPPHLNPGHMDGGRNQAQQPEPYRHQGITFWTECPACMTRHPYYRKFLSRIVCCTQCSKNFIANALPHLNPGHMDGGLNQPQEFTGLHQPQRSDAYRFTCNQGVGQTTRDITGGVRKPDSNPNPSSLSNLSGPNTNTGQMRGKRICADTGQNPNPCSKSKPSLDLNQRRGDGEGTGGTHAAGTNTSLGRSLHDKTDVKFNGTEPSCSKPAKKARVQVKGVRDGISSVNAASTNTSASICVKGEVKEHDRQTEREKEKEQVEPSGLLEKINTDLKPSGSAEDKGATYEKAKVEVKRAPDGNGSANAANTTTGASTCVEGEVKEHDREKEQVESIGLLKEKDTIFKPSGSEEDNGSTSPAANVGTLMVRCESSQSNADAEYLYEHPAAEFYNFDMCRSCNNFQEGDIWALYSDLDTFPKYYGSIRKVDHNPLQVHISWLEACPKSDVERAWLNANFPISCGKFRLTTQNTTYDKSDYFSHMVSVRHHDKGNYYEILPETGEVWAIYKNWSAGWTPRDFKTSKFDIVEIIENRKDSTIVWPLRRVPEFTSVIMPEEVDGTGFGTSKVPASAYILFSHKIPAIRLTDECGGKLKGLWELDPASVPCAIYHDK
ncbi:hypothetical protein LUZ62_026071 [Rhynchospora pubera]|uniref:J domain-containing protein n=1 Tax=Rhynchospora pubera TaxID=906938 RepID=A0AAV8HA05_9POAL|nr:hypothetical protein LUZ62_026071 [Rhynchospora pubera]